MNRIFLLAAALVVLSSSCNYMLPGHKADVYPCNTVEASVETDPMDTFGDSADDPAIWVHPTDPAKSLVIGTNKKAGLVVFNLDGKEVQFVQAGRVNNVDVRYGFDLNGRQVDIVAASNRSFNSISVYTVDPDSLRIKDIAARTIRTGLDEVYGFCLYQSSVNGKTYAFINSKDGDLEQWELFASSESKIDARKVRAMKVGRQTEGCVADDELGYLYVGEETYGIWKYYADPERGNTRKLIADTTSPYMIPDIEGLAIYYAANGGGYLLASVQGDNAYAVFERGGKNSFLGCFRIVDGEYADATEETDGIDVINMALNENFPNGFFIAQDGYNKTNGADTTQNFKMVPWERVANSFDKPLKIDNQFNVRSIGRK